MAETPLAVHRDPDAGAPQPVGPREGGKLATIFRLSVLMIPAGRRGGAPQSTPRGETLGGMAGPGKRAGPPGRGTGLCWRPAASAVPSGSSGPVIHARRRTGVGTGCNPRPWESASPQETPAPRLPGSTPALYPCTASRPGARPRPSLSLEPEGEGEIPASARSLQMPHRLWMRPGATPERARTIRAGSPLHPDDAHRSGRC